MVNKKNYGKCVIVPSGHGVFLSFSFYLSMVTRIKRKAHIIPREDLDF